MIRWAETLKYKTKFSVHFESLSPQEGKVEEEKKKGQTSLHYIMRKTKVAQRDLIKLGVEKCSNYFSNSSQLFQVY